METYILKEDISGVTKRIEAVDLDAALAEAHDWASEGDYPDLEGTIWVDVRVIDGVSGEHLDTATTQIDPPEPNCLKGMAHDWQSPVGIVGGIAENPGVWGHDGGVVIHECCMHYGARKVTDTWAQREDTGEQGLHSVSYDPPGFYALPNEAIELVNNLIVMTAGDQLPCDRKVSSCVSELKVSWGRPLMKKEYNSMCPACRAYWHFSSARNDLIQFLENLYPRFMQWKK